MRRAETPFVAVVLQLYVPEVLQLAVHAMEVVVAPAEAGCRDVAGVACGEDGLGNLFFFPLSTFPWLVNQFRGGFGIGEGEGGRNVGGLT